MAEERRTRPDFRRETTRLALIEMAEGMMAEFGVDNVSARQIGAAIGSSNNTVVAYHFGNKDALIEAIFRHRELGLEARRTELLRQVEASGAADDLLELIRVLCLPLFEQTNAQGQHSYARFLSSVFHTRQGDIRNLVSPELPVTTRLVGMIADLIPPDAARSYELRWPIVIQMVLDSLAHIDWQRQKGATNAAQWFEEALVMATTSLTATRTR